MVIWTIRMTSPTWVGSPALRARFEERLVELTGGFTRTLATGGWKEPGGAVLIELATEYQVLLDKEDWTIRYALRTLIRQTGERAKIDRVYHTETRVEDLSFDVVVT